MALVREGRAFGIGIVNAKNNVNVGALLRASFNFGAAFVFTIGRRYKKQCSDTVSASKNLPVFHCPTIEALDSHIPYAWPLVCVELCDGAVDLRSFTHPRNCVYILGPEDGSVPKAIQDRCPLKVRIPTRRCLNVGVAAAVVMYDRMYHGWTFPEADNG